MHIERSWCYTRSIKEWDQISSIFPSSVPPLFFPVFSFSIFYIYTLILLSSNSLHCRNSSSSQKTLGNLSDLAQIQWTDIPPLVLLIDDFAYELGIIEAIVTSINILADSRNTSSVGRRLAVLIRVIFLTQCFLSTLRHDVWEFCLMFIKYHDRKFRGKKNVTKNFVKKNDETKNSVEKKTKRKILWKKNKRNEYCKFRDCYVH